MRGARFLGFLIQERVQVCSAGRSYVVQSRVLKIGHLSLEVGLIVISGADLSILNSNFN